MVRLWTWALFAVAALVAEPATAQDARIISQVFSNPRPEIGTAVGSLSVQVTCPNNRTFYIGQISVGRSVRIDVSRPGIGYRQVSGLLLLSGLAAADNFCPMFRSNGLEAVGDNTVDAVSVWEAPQAGSSPEEVLRGEHFSWSTKQWSTIADLGAQREIQRHPEATPPDTTSVPSSATAASPPPRALTKAELRTKRRADRLSALAAKRAAAAEAALQKKQAADLARGMWTFGSLAVLIGLFVAAFRYRIAVMRFWYLHFDPHPATSLVQAAIASPDVTIANSALLAKALGDLPPRSAVLREARIIQAERLYGALRSASIAKQLAYAEKFRRQEVELREEIVFAGMNEALALAALALERAKAAYGAAVTLKKIGAT